jgi:UrcA family protein
LPGVLSAEAHFALNQGQRWAVPLSPYHHFMMETIMKSHTFSLGLCGMAFATMLASAPLNAQEEQSAPASAQATAHERVTVYAPFVVRHKMVSPPEVSERTATGLELVSVSRAVYFGDLDLSKPDQATTLEDRVHLAAQDACKEIAKRYPKSVYIPVPDNQDCVGNATSEAMITVKQLEAAASKG